MLSFRTCLEISAFIFKKPYGKNNCNSKNSLGASDYICAMLDRHYNTASSIPMAERIIRSSVTKSEKGSRPFSCSLGHPVNEGPTCFGLWYRCPQWQKTSGNRGFRRTSFARQHAPANVAESMGAPMILDAIL